MRQRLLEPSEISGHSPPPALFHLQSWRGQLENASSGYETLRPASSRSPTHVEKSVQTLLHAESAEEGPETPWLPIFPGFSNGSGLAESGDQRGAPEGAASCAESRLSFHPGKGRAPHCSPAEQARRRIRATDTTQQPRSPRGPPPSRLSPLGIPEPLALSPEDCASATSRRPVGSHPGRPRAALAVHAGKLLLACPSRPRRSN